MNLDLAGSTAVDPGLVQRPGGEHAARDWRGADRGRRLDDVAREHAPMAACAVGSTHRVDGGMVTST